MLHTPPTPRAGFTLIELSIVMVILGLLVGGIMAGQSLIRASDLQTILTDKQQYVSAAAAFKDKYMALPGDFNEATSIWGKDNAACAGHTGTASVPGTCNGGGDGTINQAAAGGVTGEQLQFWKQLQLEGAIKGSYTGLSGSGGIIHNIAGTNSPRGKIDSSGWSVYFISASPWGSAEWFEISHGNILTFGAQVANSINYGAVLKPEEAWNIDTKTDDGKPGTGTMMTLWNGGCTTATAQTDNNTATYDLDNNVVACRLEFPNAF